MKTFLTLLFVLVAFFSIAQNSFDRWVPTSGTDTYTTNITSFPSSYNNTKIYLRFGNGNTTASSIAVNGMSAIPIRIWGGTSWDVVTSGDIPAGASGILDYDNTNGYYKAIIYENIGGGAVWGAITGTLSNQTDLQTALNGKVNNTGNENVAGIKTFTSDPVIPDEAYGAGWNGSLEPPTKNAVYDKIETIGGGSITGSGTTNEIAYFTGSTAIASLAVATYPSLTELSYVKGVSSALQTQLNGKEPTLTSSSTSTAGATITLDLNSLTQKMFTGSATFSTSKTIAFSNATNALVFNFQFEITSVAGTLVFPSNVVMSDTNWNTSTQTWTPPNTGQYECGGTYDGTNWKVKILGPFN